VEATTVERGVLAQLAAQARAFLTTRSRTFWIVAGLTGLAAVLRFSTLGAQSFHHDEIVTAGRVVRASLWHLFDRVVVGESVPPLYYLLAWPWSKIAGTGAVGLRSLSATVGVAAIPIAYLIGAELRGRGAGIATAALVATNPMLVFYSQEARAYSLLVLLSSISLLFFLRASRREGQRDLLCWALASALALATHYFAIFPLALEAALLARARGREARRALLALAAACLLLAPLALTQASHIDNTDWIAALGLPYRLGETGVAFLVGETGYLIAQPVRPLLALVPGLLVAGCLALLALRGARDERRAAGLLGAIAAITVVAPVALALAGKDFVLDRNLIAALVPLLGVVAIGATIRRAGRLGPLLCAAAVAYSLGFWVAVTASPSLQRPDFRAVAIELGEPDAPRAMISWLLGSGPLKHYLGTHAFQVVPRGENWFVHEIDLISQDTRPPPRLPMAPRFRRTETVDLGRLRIDRYETEGLAHLPLRELKEIDIGFRSNLVLLDGIGPPE
jgi:mannosyltransferase